MQKRVLANLSILIFLFVVVSLPVVAQSNQSKSFDSTPSFEWLIDHCEEGWCGSVEATAFYAMAMKLAGYSNTYGAQAIKQIQLEKKEAEACFPKANCNIKDTAFAMWVLSNYGEDTSGIEDYIKSKLGVGLADNWWLEIITTAENKKCKIGYPSGTGQEEKEVLVDKGTFPECNAGQSETFFDLNDCISSNLVNSNPALELTIDCSTIGQGTVISIIYNSGSSYYLTEQATTAKYKTQLQNACHKKGGACDKDTSAWTNWILKNKNSDISTNLYLLTVHDNLNPVDLSFQYLTTSDTTAKPTYLEELLGLQKLDGSFNKNNVDTAVALLALNVAGSTEAITNAIKYLKSSKKADGSWDGNEKTTALVLYAAFADASITLPPIAGNVGSGDPTKDGFCGDGSCTPDESVYSCFKDCQQQPSEVCVANDICEVDYGETSQNCAADCSCGDGLCDSSEKTTCASDCGESTAKAFCGNNIRESTEECDGSDDAACSPGTVCGSSCICTDSLVKEEGGSGWIFTAIIIIVLLAVGMYITYKYYLPKKKKPTRGYPSGSSFTLPSSSNSPFGEVPGSSQKRYPPGTPTRNATRKSSVEAELERSLKEARKLLGGK